MPQASALDKHAPASTPQCQPGLLLSASQDSSTVLRSSDLSRDARPAAYRTGARDTLRGMHIYEVLAQPIRRRIVEVLASGEHTAGNLEEVVMVEFGVTRAAAQHHLRVLREHDMAVAESDWPHRSYRLNDHFVSWLELEAQRLRWLWDPGSAGGCERNRSPDSITRARAVHADDRARSPTRNTRNDTGSGTRPRVEGCN